MHINEIEKLAKRQADLQDLKQSWTGFYFGFISGYQASEENNKVKSIEDKRGLINNILCDMNCEDYIYTLKSILNNILDAEEEFAIRLDIINALKILIEKL